jgi:transposase-like protein
MSEEKKRVTRRYTQEYKEGAIKLSREVGNKKAATELNIPENTLNGWIRKAKDGEIDLGAGTRSPSEAMTPAAEVQRLRAELKEKEREIKRINEMNEFLEKAASFFAAGRQK